MTQHPNIKPIRLEQLKLQRFPLTKDNTLKAWNAADEYLIDKLSEIEIAADANILIINDQFGALSCCLSQYQPYFWTDSYLSAKAIQINLSNNNLAANTQHINQCDKKLPPQIKFDYVLIRIPKHNSLLQFQLVNILEQVDQDTVFIAAGMTKEIHKSNLKIFEQIIGITATSLAKKKARLIMSKLDDNNVQSKIEKCRNTSISEFSATDKKLKVFGLAGVFSRDSLDIGSRLLLNYMPLTKANQKLIDLGCGTGILGTYAAANNSELEVTFTDESWLAVESAKKTFIQNIAKEPIALTTDVLEGIDDNQFDHILCNPPFHQQNVQTLSIANRMFKESAKKLKSSGELRVVANRHLKYRPMLSQYFSMVSIISKDPKFVVWLASGAKKVNPQL